MRFTSTRDCWSYALTTTSSRALARSAPAIRRPRGTRHSYVRDSFWAGRAFTTLAECNRQALVWRDQVAHQRRWPGDDSRTVEQVFAEETTTLAASPDASLSTDLLVPVRSAKTIYCRSISTITPSRPKQ